MTSPWHAWNTAVTGTLETVLARARAPSERVARHWESTSALTWFGAAADHSQLHVSWSFGRLRGVESPGRATVGVFQVTRATFAEVDDSALRTAWEQLVPDGTDGATRVFLQRVAGQLAVAHALLTLAPAPELTLFARPDALDTPAPTPRWPEHARDRVTRALAAMDPAFSARVEPLFLSAEPALLEAVRHLAT